MWTHIHQLCLSFTPSWNNCWLVAQGGKEIQNSGEGTQGVSVFHKCLLLPECLSNCISLYHEDLQLVWNQLALVCLWAALTAVVWKRHLEVFIKEPNVIPEDIKSRNMRLIGFTGDPPQTDCQTTWLCNEDRYNDQDKQTLETPV